MRYRVPGSPARIGRPLDGSTNREGAPLDARDRSEPVIAERDETRILTRNHPSAHGTGPAEDGSVPQGTYPERGLVVPAGTRDARSRLPGDVAFWKGVTGEE